MKDTVKRTTGQKYQRFFKREQQPRMCNVLEKGETEVGKKTTCKKRIKEIRASYDIFEKNKKIY